MKKNYMAPATLVQSVDMDNLLAASFGDGTDVVNKEPSNDNEANQFSKKHYSVWGDDEE
ncbi:MAG: hypothetical protein ACI3ZB_01290 [Prevotella sp.]